MIARKLIRIVLLLGFVFAQASLAQAANGSQDTVPPNAQIVAFGANGMTATARAGETVSVTGLVPVTFLTDTGTREQGFVQATLTVSSKHGKPQPGPIVGPMVISTCYGTLNIGDPVYRAFTGWVEYEAYAGYVWWRADNYSYRWAQWPWVVSNYYSFHDSGQHPTIYVTEYQWFHDSLLGRNEAHVIEFTLTGSGGCSATGWFI
jgi:hypothetical protein